MAKKDEIESAIEDVPEDIPAVPEDTGFFVRMVKDLDEILVHPLCVEAHKAVGWREGK